MKMPLPAAWALSSIPLSLKHTFSTSKAHIYSSSNALKFCTVKSKGSSENWENNQRDLVIALVVKDEQIPYHNLVLLLLLFSKLHIHFNVLMLLLLCIQN